MIEQARLLLRTVFISSKSDESSFRAMFDRMPQLADGLPSRAALNELPSAIRNAPLRSLPASPIARGLSLGNSAPSLSIGRDDGQVAPRVGRDDLGLEFLPVGRANDELARSFHDVVHRDDLSAVSDHHARPEIKRDQVRGARGLGRTAAVEAESPLWLVQVRGRFRPRTAASPESFPPL